MFKTLCLALCVALAGCASLDTDTKRIETACVGASAAIKTLAASKSHLDAATVASVDKAIAVVRPVCNPGTTTPPTLDAVKLAAFNAAVGELTARAARAGEHQ